MLNLPIDLEKERWSWIALLGFVAALAAAAIAVGAGVGTRLDWWDFGQGFGYLKWGYQASFAALPLAVLGCVMARPGRQRRGFAVALAGVVIAGVTAWIPWSHLQKINTVPPIHDITTDTANPPEFVAVLPLRGSTSNSTDYAGPALAAMQQEAYPDIKTLAVQRSSNEVFPLALKTAERMGWEIVAADSGAGRIEATDTTFWFGFKDDIVIRIAPAEQSTRIDVRSISRVGGSDAGANAKRIRDFIDVFKGILR